MRLDGKTALITGASSGLGAHFASVCAEAGADIIITARRKEKLEAVAQKIGGAVRVIPCDINDVSAVEAMFSDITPDVIINNAGLSREGFSWEIEEDDWQAVIDTNLTAVWRVAKLAAQKLIKENKAGSIVNIASILSFRPAMLVAPYAASKAGVAHLTRSMAMELARHNIRVNGLAPGYIPTELNQDYLESASGQKMKARIPLKRFGTLEDLTSPLLLLTSDAGRYITGEILCVDGGHLQNAL